MADVEYAELELENETQEVELSIGDDTSRYLELEFENEIDVIDTGGDTPVEESYVKVITTSYKEGTGMMIYTLESNLTGEIGNSAFSLDTKINRLNFPNATSIGNYAFMGQTSLTESYTGGAITTFPKVQRVGNGAFSNCSNLDGIYLPVCSKIGGYAFSNCSNLDVFILDSYCYLNQCFQNCYSLKNVAFRCEDKMVEFAGTTPFKDCYHFTGTVDETYNPEGLKDGYIYVPDALVDSYKGMEALSQIADQIKPLSEIPTT